MRPRFIASIALTAFTCAFGLPATQDAAAPAGDPIPLLLARAEPARLLADVERLAAFHTRHTLSETESDERGIGAARRWLAAELAKIASATGGHLQVREQSFRTEVLGKEVELVNVYGFLPGTGVEALGRTYVVSGHYDSRAKRGNDAEGHAPGANDDASGCAVVLEAARLLAGSELSANVVFLLVAGEEQGLIGAKHFAKEAKAASWDIDGMFTNDIVGGVEGGNGVRDEVTLRCYSDAEGMHSSSRELARALAASAARYVPDARVRLVFRADRFGRGGDHQAFHAEGFPALRLTEANEHYARQHEDVREENGVQYGDLVQHVSAEYMARVARVNAAALAELALAPAPPQELALRAALSYDTQLGWAPSVGGAASYELVWRDTTAPTWTDSLPVEAVVREQTTRRGTTRMVVQGTAKGVTADTHFFGVRAVSAVGHRSRVVLPERP
jgi:acetylornithine deacetylase/succinyl-diaminopimelate desuccinylase-like protein